MTTHKAIRDAAEEGPYYTAMVAKPDLRALLADLDAKTEALKSVQAAIYMDDAGQLRLTRSFDESVIDTALKGTP